jgi:hypothetical protein
VCALIRNYHSGCAVTGLPVLVYFLFDFFSKFSSGDFDSFLPAEACSHGAPSLPGFLNLLLLLIVSDYTNIKSVCQFALNERFSKENP